MKKIILLTACLFTLSTVIKAQAASTAKPTKGAKVIETPEIRAQKNVDKINSVAVLTDDQKTKVFASSLNKAKKMDEAKLKSRQTPELREAQKKEIDAIKMEYRQSLKTILTPAQMEKLKAAKQAQDK